MSHPPGLDLDRAAGHLTEAAGGKLTGPFEGRVISGGKSNLTYLVTGRRPDGEPGRVVVRRPPLGHVLPSAHDMAREFRVTSALAGAGFPVAKPLLLCTDSDVIGAQFYVMEYVDGVVLRDGGDGAAVDAATAWRCGETLVDLLVDLHRIDPEAVGLADFGRPEGYLERQVRRWHQQWERSETRPLPVVETVTAGLLREIPTSSAVGILHGDYRLDNLMFHPDLTPEHTEVLAVMDWEMATLGDPLADVGLLVVYTDLAALGLIPTVPEGFPSGRELAERYAAAAGLPLDRLDWYVALGNYKLAVISEGIHARFLARETVGEGFERFGQAVPLLMERAAAALAGAT